MPGKRGRSWKRSPEPKSRQAWLQTIGRFTAPLHRRTRATRPYRHSRSRCTETAEPRAACGRARAVAWRASCAPRNDDRSASSLAGHPYPKDLRFLSKGFHHVSPLPANPATRGFEAAAPVSRSTSKTPRTGWRGVLLLIGTRIADRQAFSVRLPLCCMGRSPGIS